MPPYITYDESHPEERDIQNPFLNGGNNGNAQDASIDPHLEDRLRSQLADFLQDPDQSAVPTVEEQSNGNANPDHEYQANGILWMDEPTNDDIDYGNYGGFVDPEREAETQSQEASRDTHFTHPEDETQDAPTEPTVYTEDTQTESEDRSDVSTEVTVRPNNQQLSDDTSTPAEDIPVIVDDDLPASNETDAGNQFDQANPAEVDFTVLRRPWRAWRRGAARCPVRRFIQTEFGPDVEYWVPRQDDFNAWDGEVAKRYMDMLESMGVFLDWDDLDAYFPDGHMELTPPADVQRSIPNAQQGEQAVPSDQGQDTRQEIQPVPTYQNSALEVESQEALEGNESASADNTSQGPHIAQNETQHTQSGDAQVEDEVPVAPGIDVEHNAPYQPPSLSAEAITTTVEGVQPAVNAPEFDVQLGQEQGSSAVKPLTYRELWPEQEQILYWPHFAWDAGWSQHVSRFTADVEGVPISFWLPRQQDFAFWDAEDRRIYTDRFQILGIPIDWDNLDAYLHVEPDRDDSVQSQQVISEPFQQSVNSIDPRLTGQDSAPVAEASVQVEQPVDIVSPALSGQGVGAVVQAPAVPGHQGAQESQQQEDEPPSRLQEWLTADVRPDVVRNEKLLSESFAADLGRLVERFSTEQARANFLATHDLSWMPPDNDVTFPTTLDDQRRAVESLLFSMTSVRFAEDNENNNSSKTRWYPRAPGDPFYNKEKMVIRCWELVRIAMRLHRNGPSSLGCFDHEYAKLFRATSRWSFQTRIDRMAHLLATRKNRCDLVMKGESLDLLVGHPDKLLKNASSNTKNNKQKAELIQAGKGVVSSKPPLAPGQQGQAAAAPQPQAQAPPPAANAQVRSKRSAALPRSSSQQAPTSASTLQGQDPMKKRKRHSGAESATASLPAPKRARQMLLATMPSPAGIQGHRSPSRLAERDLPVPSRGRGSRLEPDAEPIQPGFRSFSSSLSSSRPSFGNGDRSSPFSNSQRPLNFSLLNTPWTPLSDGSPHRQVDMNVTPTPAPDPHTMSSRPSMLRPTFPPDTYPQPHQLLQTSSQRQDVQVQSGQSHQMRPPQTRPQHERSRTQQARQHLGRQHPVQQQSAQRPAPQGVVLQAQSAHQQGVNRQATRGPAVQRQVSQGTGFSAQGQAHGQPSVSRSASSLKHSAAEDLDGSPGKRARRE